jgi:phage shock protein PspC (stress-responsive transcriptional regulator)
MTTSMPDLDQPKRLTRSTSDHYIAGVAGGLGRYFDVDPALFRIAFGVSLFFGGLGLLAYIAFAAFLPYDDGRAGMLEGRSRTATIVVAALIAVTAVTVLGPPAFVLGPGILGLAVLGLVAAVLYRAFGGERDDDAAQMIARATLVLIVLIASLGAATAVGFAAAIGGGVAVAIIAVVAGVALIAAGLLGGPRWLILPVIVLIAPLAFVSAAGIDLKGGIGDRSYRPVDVASLRPEYRVGVGRLTLDLRSVPAADVKVRVGVGEAVVRVPANACVATDAQIGAGEADLADGGERSGLDVNVDDSTGGAEVLHLKADIGVGHLQIERDGVKAPACA